MVNHDFNELTVFAAVVEQGGLTPVAASMGLPKSTLSRRISQLENRVGQRLLLRQSNRLTPTEAGQLFYEYCRRLIDLAEQSQRSLDDLRGEASGQLVLHVHNAFERGWLPRVLDDFLQQYPDISLDVQVGSRVPQLSEESAGHLWLWLGELENTGLRMEGLGTWHAGLYSSPDYLSRNGHPSKPDELVQHAWVDVLEAGRRPLVLTHTGEPDYLFAAPASRLKVDSLVLQADAVVRGRGIGVLPNWYAQRYEQAHPGSFVPCLEQWQPPSLPVSLLSSFGHPARKITVLQQWLRAAVPADWQL